MNCSVFLDFFVILLEFHVFFVNFHDFREFSLFFVFFVIFLLFRDSSAPGDFFQSNKIYRN